ncbi:SRPBCC domain-containing protein [Psychrobacillus sp. FJAT-51614]|uniref:SRPBCC domain-containing protein n=1 Tax=Psychrobacillus mangrovi TaxID=3117745 RepID=A0ABU8FAI0_9BACI
MSDENSTSRLTTFTEGKVLVMERIFNAPRDLVFKAYSESELLESWWGPKGWKTKNSQFEFKPEGIWHYCMTCIDENQGEFYGQESWGKAIYHEIVVPEKIVYTDMFADEKGNAVAGMPELLITMIFTEDGDKTKLIARSEFATLETLQQVLDMGVVQGTSSQYDRLEELLDQGDF